MDKGEAREILRVYRPGTNDAEDARTAQALKLVQEDAELGQWFKAHCAFYQAMRAKLQQIPVPADLKDKILRESPPRAGQIIKLWNLALPFAAAAVLLLTMVGWWYFDHDREQNFVEGREWMVKLPQRGYAMNMTSTNLAAIHSYLVGNQCPDYVLPIPLASLAPAGCATLEWQGHKVSMVCLTDARNRGVYLFAMERGHLRNVPTGAEPKFEPVHRLMTASWAQGDKIYVLAGEGGESEIKRYL